MLLNKSRVSNLKFLCARGSEVDVNLKFSLQTSLFEVPNVSSRLLRFPVYWMLCDPTGIRLHDEESGLGDPDGSPFSTLKKQVKKCFVSLGA